MSERETLWAVWQNNYRHSCDGIRPSSNRGTRSVVPETPEMAVYKHNDCNMSAGLLDCGKGVQGKAGREGDLFRLRRRMFSRTTVLYFDNGFVKRRSRVDEQLCSSIQSVSISRKETLGKHANTVI